MVLRLLEVERYRLWEGGQRRRRKREGEGNAKNWRALEVNKGRNYTALQSECEVKDYHLVLALRGLFAAAKDARTYIHWWGRVESQTSHPHCRCPNILAVTAVN